MTIRMKKVAIIGKGVSAILTALRCIQYGFAVTFFYDPDTQPLSVGESTTPSVTNVLCNTLDIKTHELVEKGIVSYKMGVNFVGWGDSEQFYHNFGSNYAIHFDTKIFSEYIHDHLLKTKKATYVARKIEDEDALLSEYDFVINCAGWDNSREYIEPVFNSVNSAAIFQKEVDAKRPFDALHTSHVTTEDGWQFEIPYPEKGFCKCGYLFNSDLISNDEVKSKLNKDITKIISWKQRYAKELIPKEKIAINGNRAFFFEPLQALSLHFTLFFATFICDYIKEPSEESRKTFNSKYLQEMWVQQIVLAYHYQYGSRFESEFWNKTTANAKDMMKYQFNGLDEVFSYNLDLDREFPHINRSSIGIFSAQDHLQLQRGLRPNNKFLKSNS